MPSLSGIIMLIVYCLAFAILYAVVNRVLPTDIRPMANVILYVLGGIVLILILIYFGSALASGAGSTPRPLRP
jgi:hypothetical protein